MGFSFNSPLEDGLSPQAFKVINTNREILPAKIILGKVDIFYPLLENQQDVVGLKLHNPKALPRALFHSTSELSYNHEGSSLFCDHFYYITMLKISNTVFIPDKEIEINAIRAQGAGGQNVNKVSSAIHLRFDIAASSLPLYYKEKLLASSDKRINKEGVIVIKAQEFRTQEKNKEEALSRLQAFLKTATKVQKKRIQTKPSKNSVQKRTDHKVQRGKTKSLRKKIDF